MPCSIRFNACRLAPLAVALLAVATPAAAVEPLDTFSFRVGGYVSGFDTEVRADGETETGTDVDLDRDLGMDSDNVIGYAGLTWRPFEHHEFGFSYFQNDTDAVRRLEREIEFDGEVYEASATVRSDYSLDTYEAYYVWWAASHENWALGPRLGLVWYRMELGLELELDAEGNPATTRVNSEVSADLPAPTIGASWRWTPADDWRVSAEAGYFSVDINDVDADVTYARAGVEWYPWERTGFVLDYTLSDISADAETNGFTGNLDFQNSGLRLGVVYRF